MSRYETELKQRMHLGKIKEKTEDFMLVQSVSYNYRCPFCGHNHFEIYANGVFRCFMCSATFKRKELIKKCGSS